MGGGGGFEERDKLRRLKKKEGKKGINPKRNKKGGVVGERDTLRTLKTRVILHKDLWQIINILFIKA